MWLVATMLDSTALVYTTKGEPQLEPQLSSLKRAGVSSRAFEVAPQEADEDSEEKHQP